MSKKSIKAVPVAHMRGTGNTTIPTSLGIATLTVAQTIAVVEKVWGKVNPQEAYRPSKISAFLTDPVARAMICEEVAAYSTTLQ